MRSKFAFLPALLKCCLGEALLCRIRAIFFSVVAAKAANRSYKLIDLDAAAFGWAAAAKSRSKAEYALH